MRTRLVKKRRRRVEWEIRRSQKRASDCHDRWVGEVAREGFFDFLARASLDREIERLSEFAGRLVVRSVHDE